MRKKWVGFGGGVCGLGEWEVGGGGGGGKRIFLTKIPFLLGEGIFL